MNSFNAKNIKSQTFKQGNETALARFNISTKDNKAITISIPARYTYEINLMREKIAIAGFTNGKPNGSIIQTIGNEGIVVRVELDFSYGNYISYRNTILQILKSNKAFNLQGITTQQYQTIPLLNETKNNYIRGYATDISFDDTFNGRSVADGSDKIRFTFHEITETQKPKSKKSILTSLDNAVNFLDKIQANIGYATVSLSAVNTTLIETAKSISNFGSGVSDFISEINQLQSSIGTLINSPVELKNSFASAIKSFQGIFSSGSTTTQTQYYATLKTLCEYNNNTPLNLSVTIQKDKSELPIYSNIEKNIILGKTTIFVRATALLILCNIYQNYDFANTTEALEVWQNISELYNFFASETKFDGLAPASNISSNFTNSIYHPEAFNTVRDFVYQTLEIIRNIIFTEKEITFETITETSNLYEIIVKRYGRFDEDKLNNFMLLNNISSYLTLIRAGTQVRFN